MNVGLMRGAGSRVDATQPYPVVTPGQIQVRRCQWMIRRGPDLWAWKSCGYLIIVSPGRRYWRPTRRGACGLARRLAP
jgi:hypothetical protein